MTKLFFGRMSKMFFFTSIDLADLVEILTQENGTLSIRQSAKIPREELKIYDLNLCKSYCNSNDCQMIVSMEYSETIDQVVGQFFQISSW